LERTELLQPPTTLVPNLAWQGRTTLLAAREKIGKSTLVTQAAAALTSGGEFLGVHLERANVLWYALDEPLGDLVQRLIHHGADPDRIHVHDAPPSADEMVADIKSTGARLVVVDTLTALWEGSVEDWRDPNEIARFVRPYVRAVRITGASLALIHHTSKGGNEYLGSVQLGAIVDVILKLRAPSTAAEEDFDDPQGDPGSRLLRGKGRGGITVSQRLDFDGSRYTVGAATPSLRERVLRHLAIEAASANEVTEALGKQRQRVLAEIRQLQGDGLITRVKRGWNLSEAGVAELGRMTRVVPEPGAKSHPGTDSRDG
jgi:hypothetical protein